MRTTVFVVTIGAWMLLPVFGQVVNGSFEDGGTGWSDPCAHATYPDGGATGCGESHLMLPLFYSGSPCDVSNAGMLLQKLPWIQDGDVVDVSFWYRGIADEEDGQQWLSMNTLLTAVDGTGHLVPFDDPNSVMGFFVGDTEWHHLHRTITCSLAPGDTAMIALGGSGMSYTTGVMRFDEVLVEASDVGVRDDGGDHLPIGWYDGSRISLRPEVRVIGMPRCSDTLGRIVALRAGDGLPGTGYAVDGLRSGSYVFRAETSAGPCRVRFIR